MTWQEILAGLVVFAAAVYLYRRFRGKPSSVEREGPDVPVSRLKRKGPRRQ